MAAILGFDDKKTLVLNAIRRCAFAESELLRINSDAQCGPSECEAAKARFKATENEFGWQWRNVRELLENEYEQSRNQTGL